MPSLEFIVKIWHSLILTRKNPNFPVNTGIFVSKTQTYLLTPWSRVLLEKLIGLQLVKKFPAFYGNRRFITALTSARHLSLS